MNLKTALLVSLVFVLVLGFGPYRAVLEGLDYVADGRGLLPHPAFSRWLSRQAEAIFLRNDWSNPFQDKASEGRP